MNEVSMTERAPVATAKAASAMLSVRGLAKEFGGGQDAVRAIDDVTFDVSEGEFVCIVGPSGAGKTTLLKCLSGLLSPTEGSASFLGAPIGAPPAGLALVFQDYSRSLAPWMTVLENVELPLRAQGLAKQLRRERAHEALGSVGLGDRTHQYPWQMSGGMQQRAAIARALAYQPKLLLMDEPFASVDAQTRADLEDLILELRDQYHVTVVLVTHDIDESVYLGDRVVVLSARPTKVKEIVPIELPVPRSQVATKSDPRFIHLRSRVYVQVRRATGTID